MTNHLDHLQELRALVDEPAGFESAFNGENGPALLARHFAHVDERDAGGTIEFPSREAVLAYLRASISLEGAEARLPQFEPPFVVRRHPAIFIAETA